MERTVPLLIVDHIKIDPEHTEEVSAEVLLGGQAEQVALDVSMPELIAFVRMPDALEHHRPARNAVIDLLMRRHRGEEVALPADLSDVVRQASEPWPLRAPEAESWAANEIASAVVPIEVRQIHHDRPEPGLTTIQLDFDGTPTVVVVDRRPGPQSPARFRFVQGAHPWQLTPVEQRALLVSLLDVSRRRPGEDLTQ